jgi:hypothetical protein
MWMAGWLAHHRYETREKIEYQLLTSSSDIDIVTLHFSYEDAKKHLDWEHGGEFEYQGQMYDVIEKSTTQDSIIYRCIRDHTETKIKKQLGLLVQGALQQDENHKGTQLAIQQIVMSLYFEATSRWHSQVTTTLVHHHSRWKPSFGIMIIDIEIPPPDRV